MWAKHLGLDASELGQVGRKPDENIVGHVRVSCLINLTELNVHSELCGSHTNGGQHHRDEGTGGCKDPGEKSSSKKDQWPELPKIYETVTTYLKGLMKVDRFEENQIVAHM